MFLMILIVFSGCVVDSGKSYEGYVIGYQYNLTNYTLQTINDKENEQFVITYTSTVDTAT